MKLKLAGIALVVLLGGWAMGQRLPEVAVPQHYTLKLTPDFTTNKFAGEETIEIRVLQPATTISLNALDLTIDEARISAGGVTQTAAVAVQPANEMATLTVPKPLAAGSAQIRLRYRGGLNNKLRGLYLAQADGRKYAVTQFEPTDARRMFPSFDEPAYKATFDISIVAPSGATAISNTKLIADEPGPAAGTHTLRFATTPKMSTYLVAVLIGEFECLQGEADGIPLRVCAPPGQQQLGRFGLEATAEFMRFFNRYFSVKYPFGKLDLVAIPDFEAGAMENVGAITFRNTALLVDPKTAPTARLKQIAEVISHEMAHQWFGDLVTMRWWDDVWLNEGFASWMERKPVAAWKPEWHIEMDEQQSAQRAMAADSLENTRAIRTQAATSSQINELFDPIAYDKTAAVLRMVESYVGEDAFRAGINKYLKNHAYGNATAEDFWTTIAQVTRQPVDKIMASYVDQAGVPFVSVTGHCTDSTYVVRQQRFRLKPAAGDDQVWSIPVCFKTPGEVAQHCELLTAKEQTFKTGSCAPNVFANAGGRGYYRSNYGREAITGLAARVGELTPVERLAMVSNEWALVRMAGGHDIGAYLSLAQGMGNDRTYAVVREIGRRLAYIADNLLVPADRERFEAWVRRLFRPMIQEVGWVPAPADDAERRALRSSVFRTLAYAGRDPEAIAKAQELVQSYMRDPASVDPSLLDTIFYTAAENGTPALYDEFRARLATAKTPDVYYRYLGALAQFPDPALVKRTLEYAVSPEVRSQDMPEVLMDMLHNEAGRDLAWQFIQTHWDAIQQKSSLWGSAALVQSTAVFCDTGHKQQVQQFFSGRKLPAAERGLRQALESIQDCIDLKQQQQPKLASWLERGGAAGK